ncbi:MAG: hypothetical protein FWF52_11010 [Candidatus Azobacteroides sp.]|nr:hypothetical protein [Candidatus Azobacteroides sp.]
MKTNKINNLKNCKKIVLTKEEKKQLIGGVDASALLINDSAVGKSGVYCGSKSGTYC